MRISSKAILTLATLAASNLTQQATATNITVASQDQPAENFVMPVIAETPARIEAIASPETVAIQQFSQNNLVVQTGGQKNPTSS
ncbi:MAG: outer membrane protein assembly factor, partial [Nodularia sp. (in: cyanobacteria)]|nr:outer membrane protein assembly factor [Nodularia sp. (in: cyanobacteria)]